MRPPDRLSPEDLRSWLLNEAALGAAASDWKRASTIIRARLDDLDARAAASRGLVQAYRDLVDRGHAALCHDVLALTDRGQALRSLHPLAGFVSPNVRNAIIRAVPLG